MATVLPDSMTYSLLRRLPPQSFVIQWRKYKVNQPIPTSGIDITNSKYETNTTIQGCVNEFALLKHARVCVSVSGKYDLALGTANSAFESVYNSPESKGSPFKTPTWKYAAANLINSSRESFNAESLYVLQNTDEVAFAPVNVLRGLCARRNASIIGDSYDTGNTDDVFINQLSIKDLENAGFSGYRERADGIGFTKSGTGLLKITNAAQDGTALDIPAAGDYNFARAGVKNYEFPLGFYSSLANTYSVVPLGLLSTFSVNGYSIQLNFGSSESALTKPLYSTQAAGAVASIPVLANSSITVGTPEVKLYNVEIMVPIVQVLSPEVMNGVLSLYRKTASIEVGNVSVPMSLRMNTITYDTRSYPLTSSSVQSFQIPTTEKSVRALAWIIYDNQIAARTGTQVNNNAYANRDAELTSVLKYPLCVQNLAVKRLHCRAGRDDIVPCIDNTNPNSGEVEAFIFANLQSAAAVFSPFPYWDELTKGNVGAEEILHPLRSKAELGYGGVTNSNAKLPEGHRARSNMSVQYGAFSFMNMDYRAADSGQIASGISMNNIGRFDVDMEFRGVQNTGNNVLEWTDATLTDKRITFIVAYDEVLESSANQGIQIITNAVMM